MDNKERQIQEETTAEETIFSDEEFLNTGYDKRIRHARTAIFVVGGVQVLAAVILAYNNQEELPWLILALNLFFAAIFIGLGFWVKNKPFAAIVTALCLYVGIIILNAIDNPATIIQGVVLKIIIIVYLGTSIGNAREAERIKTSMGK